MSKILKSTKCLSCGGIAFRTDRPYGDFCSMMCAFRGIQTEDEKEEEYEQIRKILKKAKETHTREIRRNVKLTRAIKPTEEGNPSR